MSNTTTSTTPTKRRRSSTRQKEKVVYCICKQPYDEEKGMIACDVCDNWFHWDCIGVDQQLYEDIDQYACEACEKSTGRVTTYKDLFVSPPPLSAPHSSPSVNEEVKDEEDYLGSDGEDSGSDYEVTSSHRTKRAKLNLMNPDHSDDELETSIQPKRAPSGPKLKRRTKASSVSTPTVKAQPPDEETRTRRSALDSVLPVLKPLFGGDEAKTSQFGDEMEAKIWEDGKGDRKKYMDKMRSIRFNVAKEDRVALRTGISSGNVTAIALATMTSTDLASNARQQELQNLQDSLLSSRLLIKSEDDGTRVHYTHKGALEAHDPRMEAEKMEAIERTREEQESRRRAVDEAARREAETFVAPSPAEILQRQILLEQEHEEEEALYKKSTTSPQAPSKTIIGQDLSPEDTSFFKDAFIDSPESDVSPPKASVPLPAAILEKAAETESKPKLNPSSRPSFDLSSVWGNSGEANDPSNPDATFSFDSFTNDGGEALDISDVLTNDVLPQPESGVVTAPKNSAREVAEEKEKGVESMNVVWNGRILNADGLDITSLARQIGGKTIPSSSSLWSLLIPTPSLSIIGRVPVKSSREFLQQCRLNPNKDLVVVAFEDTSSSEEMKGKGKGDNDDRLSVFEFLHQRNRDGLVNPYGSAKTVPTGAAKDMYLLAIKHSDPLPEVLELMDSFALPSERTKDYLIGIFVRPKSASVSSSSKKSSLAPLSPLPTSIASVSSILPPKPGPLLPVIPTPPPVSSLPTSVAAGFPSTTLPVASLEQLLSLSKNDLDSLMSTLTNAMPGAEFPPSLPKAQHQMPQPPGMTGYMPSMPAVRDYPPPMPYPPFLAGTPGGFNPPPPNPALYGRTHDIMRSPQHLTPPPAPSGPSSGPGIHPSRLAMLNQRPESPQKQHQHNNGGWERSSAENNERRGSHGRAPGGSGSQGDVGWRARRGR